MEVLVLCVGVFTFYCGAFFFEEWHPIFSSDNFISILFIWVGLLMTVVSTLKILGGY